MAETDLTKRIKQLTHSCLPKLKTSMRTIRWADEVWTPTGIVDSIRFEDYYVNKEYLCRLIPDDIGILVYYEGNKSYGLRKYKSSRWRDVPDKTKVFLLYNAMKKWCDGATFI